MNRIQTSLVSVYYHGSLITNTTATFDHNTIAFKFPKMILAKLTTLNPLFKSKVEKSLSLPLPNHKKMLCPYSGTGFYCAILKPKVAGVIFDPDRFRAELFINPVYIQLRKQRVFKILPSTSGFSYLANNNIVTTGAMDKDYNNTSSITTSNIIAYKNQRLRLNANLTRYSAKTTRSSNELDINNFTYNTVFNKHQLTAGMFESLGSDLISSHQLLGFSFTNHGFFTDPTQDQGIPIPIFLTAPSKVDIYRGKSLMSSKYYTGGKHYLDTSSLEDGAYGITIKITSQAGLATKLTRFFVKQGSLPKMGAFYYQVDWGVLKNNVNQINQVGSWQIGWPKFTRNTLSDFAFSRRLMDRVGIEDLTQTDFHQIVTNVGFSMLFDHMNIQPGFVLGSQSIYGLRLYFTYEYKSFSLNLEAKRLFSSKERKPAPSPLYSILPDAAGYYAYANIGFLWHGNSISFGSTVDHYEGQSLHYLYSGTISRTLFQSDGGVLDGNLTTTRSYQDTSIALDLAFNFTVPNVNEFSGRISMSPTQHKTNAGSLTKRLTANVQLNKGWRLDKDGHKHLSTTLNYNKNYNGRTFYLGNTYTSNGHEMGQFELKYNTSNDSNANDLNYTGSAQVSFVSAEGHVGVVYSNIQNNGVLVNVKAPKDIDYQVYVDKSASTKGVANHNVIVPVTPYMPHQISITQTGKGLYNYDKSPREVNLYQGNIQALNWTFAKQFILFAQIVDTHQHGIDSLLIEGLSGFDQTGQGGYFQITIGDNMKALRLRSINNETCMVTLPKNMKAKDGLVMLKKPLICRLEKLKRHHRLSSSRA